MEPHLSITAWQEVSGEAARMLMNRADSRFLTPFLGQDRSLSEAARVLDVRRDTLLYRIRRMLDVGLLTLSPAVPGPGRVVKRYRAAAGGFIVKFAHSEAASMQELFLQRDLGNRELLARGLLDSVVGEGGWHLRIYRDDSTGLTHWEAAPDSDPSWGMGRLLEEGAPAAWYTNATLQLTASQAKRLQYALARLNQETLQQAGQGEQTYTLQLGLALVGARPDPA